MKSTKSLITLIFIFIILTMLIKFFPLNSFDLMISQSLQKIDSPVFLQIMDAVSRVGDNPFVAILVGFTFMFLIFMGKKSYALTMLFLTISSFIVGSFLKMLVNRPRPTADQVDQLREHFDKSFPSLHVLVFTVFFGYLLYLAFTLVKNTFIRKTIIFISLFMIISVSFSRIYLGAHWASDTIGGYLLGFLFIKLAITYAKR